MHKTFWKVLKTLTNFCYGFGVVPPSRYATADV